MSTYNPKKHLPQNNKKQKKFAKHFAEVGTPKNRLPVPFP
jgi:hypothetical protein